MTTPTRAGMSSEALLWAEKERVYKRTIEQLQEALRSAHDNLKHQSLLRAHHPPAAAGVSQAVLPPSAPQCADVATMTDRERVEPAIKRAADVLIEQQSRQIHDLTAEVQRLTIALRGARLDQVFAANTVSHAAGAKADEQHQRLLERLASPPPRQQQLGGGGAGPQAFRLQRDDSTGLAATVTRAEVMSASPHSYAATTQLVATAAAGAGVDSGLQRQSKAQSAASAGVSPYAQRSTAYSPDAGVQWPTPDESAVRRTFRSPILEQYAAATQ